MNGARHRSISAQKSCPLFYGLLLANCHTSILLIKNLSGSTEVFQRRPWRRQTLKALPPRGGGHQLAVSPAHFFIRPKLFLLSLSPFFVRQNFFVFVVTLFILPTLLILSCLSRTLFYPTKLFVRVVTLFILLAVSHAHFLS